MLVDKLLSLVSSRLFPVVYFWHKKSASRIHGIAPFVQLVN